MRRKSFEGGHAVSAFANHFGHLFIRHLRLPVGARKIRRAHHRTLRPVAATRGPMTPSTVSLPREFHEAFVRSSLVGRTRLGSHLARLTDGLIVIRCSPFAHVARRLAATRDDECCEQGSDKSCGIRRPHGDEMTESSVVGERFSRGNDHDAEPLRAFRQATSSRKKHRARGAVAKRPRARMERAPMDAAEIQPHRRRITARMRPSRRARWHRPACHRSPCP